jgi:hypothetical protein
MPSERDRTRLIAELASLLHECHLPEDARCASLTLIGWLARRMPGEAASTDGVEHAQKQLEVHGLLESRRARPGKSGATTVSVRVETRSLVVRARRGRPSEAADASALGPVAAADTAPVPRPNGRREPLA